MRINIFYVLVGLVLLVAAEGVYILVSTTASSETTPSPLAEQISTTIVPNGTAPTIAPTMVAPSPLAQKTFPPLKGPLVIGMKGNEVKILQQMLAEDKAVYPEALIDGYYSKATVDAVQRFQIKYNIFARDASVASGFGVAGPKTRTQLNELYAPTVVTTTTRPSSTPPPTPTTAPGVTQSTKVTPPSSPTSLVIATNSTSGDKEAPSVPGGLSASATSENQINLTWRLSNDNQGVAGYQVYRNDTPVAKTVFSRYANINLLPDTEYTFTLVAYDNAGNVSARAPVVTAKTPPHVVLSPTSPAPPTSASDSFPPTVPTGLVATVVSSTQINLTWGASADEVGVLGYNVYRNGVQIGMVGATNYADVGVVAATPYTYAVAAYDGSGNTSAQSSAAYANTSTPTSPSPTPSPSPSPTPTPTPSPSPTPTPAPPPPGPTPPPAPASCTSTTINSCVLTGVASGGSSGTCGSGTTGSCNYTCNNGVWTVSTNSCVAPPADTAAPTTPTGLSATAVSSTQINLSWTASTDNVGVTAYRVYEGATQITSVAGTTYSHTGLSPSTSHTYTVAAYDAAGNGSAQSTSASATTSAPPAAPTTYNVSVSDLGSPITPSSLTIKAGDTVNFNFVSTNGEAKMRFTPTPPANFTLDKDINTKSYTFTTTGTWTYNGGGPTATIIVQ